jgi:polyisoprenoid-binding protein YceI
MATMRKPSKPMKGYCLLLSVAAVSSLNAAAADSPTLRLRTADQGTGTVGFSGTHAGDAFRGTFRQWESAIVFDPAVVAKGHISARFELGSARTGNAMYDGTLPKADWLDVEVHPHGTFVSSRISENRDGSYTVAGVLTLRGIARPISFPLSITPAADGSLSVKGEFAVDRLAYGIGAGSDPSSEWVGRQIAVQLELTAR